MEENRFFQISVFVLTRRSMVKIARLRRKWPLGSKGVLKQLLKRFKNGITVFFKKNIQFIHSVVDIQYYPWECPEVRCPPFSPLNYNPSQRSWDTKELLPPPTFNFVKQVIASLFVRKKAIISSIYQGVWGIRDTAQVSQLLLARIVDVVVIYNI